MKGKILINSIFYKLYYFSFCYLIWIINAPDNVYAINSTEIYKRAQNSVVSIETKKGIGTGFVIEGFPSIVITNYHVVVGNSDLSIKTSSGKSVKITGPVYLNKYDDMAALIVDEKLPGIQLSKKIQIGQKLYVLGNPIGLKFSFSDGILSNIYKEKNAVETIQFTAPIEIGSSGSPIIDENGKVIGITQSMYKKIKGFGFGAPFYKIEKALKAYNIAKLTKNKFEKKCIELKDKASCQSIGDSILNSGLFELSIKWFDMGCKYGLHDSCSDSLKAHYLNGKINFEDYIKKLGNECLKDEKNKGCLLMHTLNKRRLANSKIEFESLSIDFDEKSNFYSREIFDIMRVDKEIELLISMDENADYLGYVHYKDTKEKIPVAIKIIDFKEGKEEVEKGGFKDFFNVMVPYYIRTIEKGRQNKVAVKLLDYTNKSPYVFHFEIKPKNSQPMHEELLMIFGDINKGVNIDFLVSNNSTEQKQIIKKIKEGIKILNPEKLIRFKKEN